MSRIFEIERRFDAAPGDVWRALTEADLMRLWYFDLKEFRTEPGFVFEFTGGPKDGEVYHHICEILEVVPERKLVHTWSYRNYPGMSTVTFELIPDGDGTILRLTHQGLESFPKDKSDFAFENFSAGWTQIIGTSLANFLNTHKP